MLFFSLGRQREETRENSFHASMQTKCGSFALCCGTRYAQTSPRTAYGTMLSHLILYLHLSLSQPFNDKSTPYTLMAVVIIIPLPIGKATGWRT